MTEEPDIWERGYEVEDLLGKRPAWITRWGVLGFTVLIALLVTGAWIIRYPDILYAPVEITYENPPAALVARVDGRITGLYVTDNQEVMPGDELILLENPASRDDIRELESLLTGWQPDSAGLKAMTLQLEKKSWSLGDMQPLFSAWTKALQDYRQFLEVREFPNRVKALRQEEKMTRAYAERLRQQGQVLEKDMKLGRKQYLRDSALFAQRVIPQSEFEKSESGYLQKKFSLEGNRVDLADTRIRLTRLEKDILDQSLQYRQVKSDRLTAVRNAGEELLNGLGTWKQQYLIISPVSGKVTFNRVWSLNQQVKSGQTVVTVVPPGKSRILGKVSLPVEGAGKVRTGQVVNVKFTDYPYLEYGIVRAEVVSRSAVPVEGSYLVEITFPGGLVTTYGRSVGLQASMTGTAEIITDDVRLIERIFNPVRHLLTRYRSGKQAG